LTPPHEILATQLQQQTQRLLQQLQRHAAELRPCYADAASLAQTAADAAERLLQNPSQPNSK
jgi:hypothetical protein